MTAFVLRLVALVFLMSLLFMPFDRAHLAVCCSNLGVACGMFGLSFDTARLRTKVDGWRIPRTNHAITAFCELMSSVLLVTAIVAWWTA